MLKQGKPQDIANLVKRMQSEGEQLFDNLLSLVYFFRGAVQLADSWFLTYAERQKMQEFLDKRFEIEKTRPTPIY